MDEISQKKPDNRRRSSTRLPLQNNELGKIPPQAVDLEEAVLGALMLEKEAVNEVIDILKAESFYKESHQKIFTAIHELFQRSEPIDILTVTAELRKMGELEIVGGAYYISYLTNRVASSANIQFHARIISQKHILRELIRISSDTIREAYEESTDVFDLLDKAERDLFTVAQGNIRKEYDTMSDVIKQAIENIEAAKKNVDGVSGVPSGFHALDRITSGWQRSDMIIIAARPGMGKTAFVISMARNIAVDFNLPVAIFSLEMSSIQLVNRLISGETGIRGEKIRKGNLEDHEFTQLHTRIKKLSKAPIFIDDTPSLSVFELRAKARRLKSKHDIQLIIVDYLQLMTAGSDKGNREQEISTISRSIKTIAKELNIPIIALSQLSRAVETRGGDKKPMLSDLRESGAIEQDADIVSFIYRPEYYDLDQDEEGNSLLGIGQVIIAKHRNGALDTVSLKFVKDFAKFENLETIYDDQPGLPGGSDFDRFQTITMQSRMNDDSDDDFFSKDNDDSSPF
ncbi:MAG: replicative DNA helicase [Flavobacteriales bacterium]|nr:replicative DNA helicase [Flavobacteriales bacterium]